MFKQVKHITELNSNGERSKRPVGSYKIVRQRAYRRNLDEGLTNSCGCE